MQPNSKTRLYTILKVDKTATNDELKRSYKRLALQHHPDKNPNDLDLFKQIKHAYDILSDPKKRKIYDKYGERGLELMSTFGDSGLDEDIGTKLNLFFIILNLFTILLILFFSFLSAKDDNSILWHYSIIFIPLWLIDCGFLFGILNLLKDAFISWRNGKNQTEEENDDVLNQPTGMKMDDQSFMATLVLASVIVFTLSLIIIFQVLLVLKIDDTLNLSGVQIFSPLIILEGLALIKTIVTLILKLKHSQSEYVATIGNELWPNFIRCLQIILVICKLDATGFETVSWAVVFIPMYLLFFIIVYIIRTKFHSANHSQLSDNERPDKNIWLLLTVLFALICLFFYPFLGLLIKKLDDPNSIRLVMVLVPIFILLSFMLCCFGCCIPCCCFMALNTDLGEEVTDQVRPLFVNSDRLITQGYGQDMNEVESNRS